MVDEGKKNGLDYITCNDKGQGLGGQRKHEVLETKLIRNQFGPPTLALCEQIVYVHDDDGDGSLQFEEILQWLVAGECTISTVSTVFTLCTMCTIYVYYLCVLFMCTIYVYYLCVLFMCTVYVYYYYSFYYFYYLCNPLNLHL